MDAALAVALMRDRASSGANRGESDDRLHPFAGDGSVSEWSRFSGRVTSR